MSKLAQPEQRSITTHSQSTSNGRRLASSTKTYASQSSHSLGNERNLPRYLASALGITPTSKDEPLKRRNSAGQQEPTQPKSLAADLGYRQSAFFIYQPGMLPLLKWQPSHRLSYKSRASRPSRSTCQEQQLENRHDASRNLPRTRRTLSSDG